MTLERGGELNLLVPDDLAIVGFDDLDMVSHLKTPLTTVARPLREMGRRAAEILVRRIRGERIPVQQVVLPTALIIRESCGRHG